MVLAKPATWAFPCLALVFFCLPTRAAPFSTTDQNPLLNGFALAPSVPARLPANGTTRFSGTLNWSSTAAIQRTGDETLIIDVESREWRVSVEHALSDKFSLRVQLPYRTSSGGSLDGFVDNWHSFFGLPSGSRPSLPEDSFRIDYQRGQTHVAYSTNTSRNTSGIGDVSFAAGYQLPSTSTSATSFWLNLKAPTGDSNQLTGSGAFDASLALAHERILSSRWLAFAQIAGTYLGKGDLLSNQQTHLAWSGLLGFDYRYSTALTLTVQLDGHTSAFKDSGLDLLGNAWVMTIGGEYRWRSHWSAQIGVSEDVKVDASPDVTFVFSVARSH